MNWTALLQEYGIAEVLGRAEALARAAVHREERLTREALHREQKRLKAHGKGQR